MPDIERIAVVGAGLMGSGIAESVAAAGIDVTVYERELAPLERSRRRLAESLERAVSRGKLTREDAGALTSRIGYTTLLNDLDGVEAVFEDPQVKGQLFQELDARLPDAQFLASNTSSIPIAELAAWTKRPERVVGLHFFSPVPVMRLVVDAYLLAGDFDYLLKVATESFETYESFLRERLRGIPSLASIETTFAFGLTKSTSPLPLK